MGNLDFSFLSNSKMFLLNGTLMTLQVAFFTVILGVIIGTIVAIAKLSKYKIVRFIFAAYVEFLRGTPLLVQLYLVVYGLPGIFPSMGEFARDHLLVMVILALSINSSAYVAEIMRSGILSIDKGQTEASRSLGMTAIMTMRYIILPQAIKNILPALGNEFIVVVKESSIISIVGISEIMYKADSIRNTTYRPFEPLIVAALIYFVITFTLSKLLGVAERRMRKSDIR